MTDLYRRSIGIILQNQTPSGAYLASPNFPTYHYCWFRDGAFIAYAMNLVGEHDSAKRFHQWAATAINARVEVVARAVAKARRGEPLTGADYLHTRYLPNGDEAVDEWPNFQLDGFGTWLWALGEHQRLSDTPLSAAWQRAAQLVADYLRALWSHPCYDCWEEFPDHLHPYTLAAIYGGLEAHACLTGKPHAATVKAIRHFLRTRAIADGHFVKFIGSRAVDASLLGLAIPYRVVAPNDPLMQATVERIERDLRRGGGLHRYSADTYYGGGEWILLTAWLGWFYAEVGQRDKASVALNWLEAQAHAQGWLPEQIPATLNDPRHYTPWRERWGEIASPLLWSHAMHIILCTRLQDGR
jgi:GH15 family glucan-1,4-alpha-glucosidase